MDCQVVNIIIVVVVNVVVVVVVFDSRSPSETTETRRVSTIV